MGYASQAAAPEINEVHCEACGIVLMRFPAGRFMRRSDQTPGAVVIVCSECGSKNSWAGAA